MSSMKQYRYSSTLLELACPAVPPGGLNAINDVWQKDGSAAQHRTLPQEAARVAWNKETDHMLVGTTHARDVGFHLQT